MKALNQNYSLIGKWQGRLKALPRSLSSQSSIAFLNSTQTQGSDFFYANKREKQLLYTYEYSGSYSKEDSLEEESFILKNKLENVLVTARHLESVDFFNRINLHGISEWKLNQGYAIKEFPYLNVWLTSSIKFLEENQLIWTTKNSLFEQPHQSEELYERITSPT